MVAVAASLFWLLAHITNNYYLLALNGESGVPISFFINFFYWIAFFLISFINFTPPFLIRYFFIERPLYGEMAILASFANYATVMIVMAFPWQLIMGGAGGGIFLLLLSRTAKIICAAITIMGGYKILTIPLKEEEFAPPQDNQTKCMLKLANFISHAKSNLGSEVSVERLWQTVYSYIKNDDVISGAMNRGIPVDMIVINAVGAVAYKFIESGRFHESRGVLSPEGRYIASVWKMAAEELVRRSFNSQQDMERGLAALEAAIASAG
jgi:hypothetical protein